MQEQAAFMQEITEEEVLRRECEFTHTSCGTYLFTRSSSDWKKKQLSYKIPNSIFYKKLHIDIQSS